MRIIKGPKPEGLTQNSILTVASDGFDAWEYLLGTPGWYPLGYIVKTEGGIFTNTQITDENSLNESLNGTKKFKGIYFINSKTVFAPYKSFKRGVQDREEFAHGGLARALEHTPERVAEGLGKILSFYRDLEINEVNVSGFDAVEEPVLKVVGLLSNGRNNDGVNVISCDWDDYYGGYAFGVLKSAEGDAKK